MCHPREGGDPGKCKNEQKALKESFPTAREWLDPRLRGDDTEGGVEMERSGDEMQTMLFFIQQVIAPGLHCCRWAIAFLDKQPAFMAFYGGD